MRDFVRLAKRARDGIYFVEFDGGRRRTLGTRDKKEARRLFLAIKKEVLAGRLADITGECHVTLQQYYDEWEAWAEAVQKKSTFRANRLALKKLIDVAGGSTKLDRLGMRHLDEMVAVESRAKRKPTSINNYIRHARAVLNKAVEWNYLKTNPLAGAKEIPVPKTNPQFLETKAEVTDFIKSIKDQELKAYVIAYLATGRRRIELLGLRWEHVRLEEGRYYIDRTKRHLSRWYKINHLFRTVLLSRGPQKTGPVFRQWHADTLSKKVGAALTDAGHPDISLHDLRHTYSAHQLMQGRTLKELQDLLGHTESRTTEIYAHLADSHMDDISEVDYGPVEVPKAEQSRNT